MSLAGYSRSGVRLSLAALPFVALNLVAATPAAPRPPADEQRSLVLADTNLTIELVAAEPQIISPVAVAWDAAGRLFVAEMRDYPNATNGGTIRLLRDRDGDGRYETAVIFADQLRFPNSVLPWNGGVLVTAAPDLLFLKDTNGDGVADERRVVLTGFGAGNQQLRVNGLTWGQDGWVYGANGRSDGAVRRPGTTNTTSLRGRDFRFRPESGEVQTLVGRCQFGLALDDWGNRFLSWNTIPIRHEVFPDRYLASHPILAGAEVLVDLLPSGDGGRVYPLTPPPLVFNNESSGHFNALAGLTLFRGHALGPAYRGNVFVGESLRNLVHRRVLEPAGVTFVARRGEEGTEFLGSDDPWFHPVNFATGPDGALYVVDFYRQFVEHPDFVPREMRGQIEWRTGSDHGRIWRITSGTSGRSKPRTPPARPSGDLATMSAEALVSILDDANTWRRETAHRLLVEKKDATIVDALRVMSRKGSRPEGRVLALQALAIQTGALDDATIQETLRDSDPHVRACASQLAAAQWTSASLTSTSLVAVVLELVNDVSPTVRLAAALGLGKLPEDPIRESLLQRKFAQETNRWVRLAIASAARTISREQVAEFLPRSARVQRPAPVPAGADPDRQKVIDKFTPALQMTGDRARGAVTFAKLCLSCHYLQGRGARVGPDLSGISARPPEALLSDFLDPSRQIAPEYAAYEATLADGESIVGLFASETETRVTLRRPGVPDDNVPRARLKSIRPTGKSLMPDGLEAGLGLQDMADLLGFMRNPDSAMLPP